MCDFGTKTIISANLINPYDLIFLIFFFCMQEDLAVDMVTLITLHLMNFPIQSWGIVLTHLQNCVR